MDDLVKRLRELCERHRGATPGPWACFYKQKYDEWHVSVPVNGPTAMKLALFPNGIPTECREADANAIGGIHEMLAALHDAADEIERLRKEVEALRVDAERYRWLRSHFEFDYCKGTCDYWRITGESKTLSMDHQTLDAAIDAAMKGRYTQAELDAADKRADERHDRLNIVDAAMNGKGAA
jgi:hypothetical protein